MHLKKFGVITPDTTCKLTLHHNGSFTVQEVPDANAADASGTTATATITVTEPTLVGPPNVTPASTNPNRQTTSGLVITPAAADGSLVTNYLITGISGGTLFLNDGTTPISSGSLITTAQGQAGLKFTPNSASNGSFTVQEVPDANAADASGTTATATITVTEPTLVGPPNVTPASTNPNRQTTSGLVITPAAADGSLVTNYLITGISGGTLFLNDGTTPISSGSLITTAQGQAGLKFTPNSASNGSFTVQEVPDANAADASGTTATATITVTEPTLVGPPNVTPASTGPNLQTTSGLVITPAAADGSLVTNYLITGISGGTLFLNDGTTPISSGSLITTAQGQAGLKFTPNSASNGSFTVQEVPDANAADASGTTATATITVTEPTLVGPPNVTPASTGPNLQTTSGLVITPAAADGSLVTNYLITGITGGMLYLNDGVTQVTNGQLITTAQGQAGLKFTPNSTNNGSFTVQEVPDANIADASGATAIATITVTEPTLVGPPNVTPAFTNPNDQTTSGLVITPAAADNGLVANYLITGITEGTLFLNDGVTQVTNGQLITAAQGQAGLKFTPNSTNNGSFTVQEVPDAKIADASGATASATITSAEEYVTGLYSDVLKRMPDALGLNTYSTLLENGVPTSTITADIWQSKEHRGIQVDQIYQTYLHRPADPGGRENWINNMLSGLTEEKVTADFLNSHEYLMLHSSATSFVTGLYQDVLSRLPDSAGLSNWVGLLISGVETQQQVIQSFIVCKERNLKTIDSYYNDFLSRPPDEAGQEAWLQVLEQGLLDDQGIAEAFLSSQEFLRGEHASASGDISTRQFLA